MNKRIVFILVVSMMLLSIVGCADKTTTQEVNEETTEESGFVNYDITKNWQIHKSLNDMTDYSIQYYAIKQCLISKVEKLLWEDAYLQNYSFDRNDITFDEYVKTGVDSPLKDFYTAMGIGESELTDYCFNYLKERYPDKVTGSSDEYFENYVKQYFSNLNSFENNKYLKAECENYLLSFKLDKKDWITYDYKDRFYCHLESLKQFVPEDSEIKKNNGYALFYTSSDGSSKTLLQNLSTGEVISINDRVHMNNIDSLYSFDFTAYDSNGDVIVAQIVEEDGIENRVNDEGVYFAEAEEVDDPLINEEIQNAWENAVFTYREDKCSSTEINAVELIEKGYQWGVNDKNARTLTKVDEMTGRCHIITLKD